MPESVLEIDRISKRYGNVTALRDMTFSVRAGEMFGFVGSNGAGKTTTMRIALGVLAADSGEVRFDGAPLDLRMRRRIGYMPEERGLYPKMRAAQQLAYLGELHGMSRHGAREAADRWIDRLGLTERRDEEVQKLSLGNQQRVQLAAALVHEPDILVLDEPFSGLDPVAVDVMSQVLRDACDSGVPVVFSSHQLDLVQRLCDRVGIVRKGEMVANGTVEELRDSGPTTLLVDVPNAPADWAEGTAGVRKLGVESGRTRLELSDDADDQAVLAAAMATGPVREFARYRPALTELFRNAVTEESAA
ncbi:ABC-2 type transport system ATP-binding protein [Saccharopolyspora lacisalsi]|uniref:ABC-2 type transport system ATP-binding protein n=1 Tax=Halosaccharopolyspora lacisalsi TaxID=1000566 RepID=A0A839E0F2_9PSEU|nr:ATP-binding cassette domain-containing protein [Halosaccharopolyspora lacisalsi]MBA8826763.1 ABC-2 type transport system ATP-binding protein [Halosaccharopolyspora lacisalsi]